MLTSQQTDKVIPALFKVKEALRPMVKDSNNPFFKSKYLELSDILTNLEPILHGQSLFLTQATVLRDGRTVVINRITHVQSQQYVESEFPAEVATADPQKLGSAVSYARRYGIQALLSLNVIDDDGNAASGKGKEPSTPPAARQSGFGRGAKPEDKAPPAANPGADKESEPAKEPAKEEAPAAPSARRGSFGGRT